jgi:uncharacterized protein YndB with AHSA1/START domain
MTDRDFTCSVEAAIPPATVFRLIHHVSDWWVTDVEGEAASLGDVFTVRSGTTWVTFRVVESVPGEKMVWQVVDCDLPWNADKTEWNNTAIIWKLTASEGGTRIKFTHRGLVPEVECYNQCAKSWSSYIRESLHNLITSGVGLPNKF